MVITRPVLIVDDEFLARELLKGILNRQHPDIVMVAEAANSEQAWSALTQHPHIQGVFLDIHIQNENERAGLDLAGAINRLPNSPWIVFMTGYPQHAVEAHRLHPAHFLVKPLDGDKVAEALDWIRKTYPLSQSEPPAQQNRIEVRHRVTNRFDEVEWHTAYLEPTEIGYVAKNPNANTLRIRLLDGKVLDGINRTIEDFDKSYHSLGLIRISRSHIVFLKQVRSLIPHPFQSEGHKVVLKEIAEELSVGDKYLDNLRDKMKKALF